MNMHGEKSKETGEELISLLTDLEDINERDAFGAAAVQAQNPVEKSSGALQRGSMSMGIVGRELPGSCRSFSSQGGLSQGVLMDDEDEDEEHLNTVDFCNARLQGRTHLSALSAATRGWPAPIRCEQSTAIRIHFRKLLLQVQMLGPWHGVKQRHGYRKAQSYPL